MFRILIVAILAILASPASAQDSEKMVAFVTQFAETVNRGEPINMAGISPDLLDSEKAALAALKGCSLSVGPGAHRTWIELDWKCETQKERERQTALKFEPDGSASIWINPIEDALAPTSVAQSSEDLPSYRNISRDFAKAVKKEADPTLDGLIPITPEHIEKLKLLEGLDFRKASGSTRRSQTMFWDLRSKVLRAPVATDLRFDDEGRPIGLILSATSIVRN